MKLANVVQDQEELKKIILNERALWEEVRENKKKRETTFFFVFQVSIILKDLSLSSQNLVNELNIAKLVMYKEPKQPFYVKIL